MEITPELISKLQKYQVPESAAKLIKKTHVVFLVGITAAGKDTVIHELLKSGDYHYIVSHTTRQPRYNHGLLETDGSAYHFIDVQQASDMLDNNEFVEAKLVHGNIYGTSVAEIKDAHDKSEIAISEIEVQGIAEYRAISSSVLPIFLLPPDFETWQQRLQKRYEGQPDRHELQKRMQTAKSELAECLEKDYFEFVVNRDLNKTIEIVDEISHGRVSSKKNDQAKEIAKDLLYNIEKKL